MNIAQEAIDRAARSLARQLDREIRETLTRYCPTWSMADVKERCTIVRIEGNPVETLYMDGVPLLEMHPVKSELVREDGVFVLRTSRDCRQLMGVKK